MDHLLFEVLENSGYLMYLGYFAVNKWTRARLLKADDLEKVMREILPKKIPQMKSVINKIINELKKTDYDVTVKKEEKNDDNEAIFKDQSDDEVTIIDTKMDSEVLSIESDQSEDEEKCDINEEMTVSSVVASTLGPSSLVQASSSHTHVRAERLPQTHGASPATKRVTFAAKRMRLQEAIANNEVIDMTSSEDLTDTLTEPSITFDEFLEKKIKKTVAVLDSKSSNADQNPMKLWSDWTRIFSQKGPNIDILVCESWTWKPIEEECPLNLLNLLTNVCPQIEELYIKSECSFQADCLSLNLQLKNLKILVINHGNGNGLLDYHEILPTIIMAANGNLEGIVFSYQDEIALKRFLNILTYLRPEYLENLNLLRIKRWDEWHIALLESDLLSLAKINAKQLSELDLQLGFWDDVKLPFEEMLNTFATLNFLSIPGCFVTAAEKEPSITINFPHMPNLQKLDMGQSYQFSTVFENTSTRPAKRKESIPRIEKDSENEVPSRTSKRTANDFMEDQNGEFFAVTISFRRMSKLTHLCLGALYELHQLPFADMPNLQIFKVASGWHCLSQFKERNTYPNIKEIQIPDYFEDYNLLPRILGCFPKLKKVYMNLPTVKVIRAFSKCMKDVKSFKKLELQVQFDFESSLDSCFLEEPCKQPLTQAEAEKFKVLKEYPEWKNYAATNRVEVPEFMEDEDIEILEDKTKFSGLHVLQKKLENGFSITFVPRTLRLPKGEFHWNDDKCEFSNTIIGFREQKYIFTKKAWGKTPIGIKIYGFNLIQTKATRFVYEKIEQFVQCDPFIPKGSKKESTENEELH